MSDDNPNWILRARVALADALDEAAQRFADKGKSVEGVHDARKALKRARALTRLFEDSLEAQAAEARSVVNAARRALGRTRDLDVMPDTARTLHASEATREALLFAITRERKRGASDAADEIDHAKALAALADKVRSWPIHPGDDERALRHMRETYRKARRLGRAAFPHNDGPALHRVRSLIVDLGQQFDALAPPSPTRDADLRKLRQALGVHHDLTVLAAFALERRELLIGEKTEIREAIERQQRSLTRRARRRFSRAFGEPPQRFLRRLKRDLSSETSEAAE